MQARAQALRHALIVWWDAHAPRLADLPEHRELNRVRAEFLDTFGAALLPLGAPPEAYLEWADTSPVPMSTVAEELGVLSTSPEQVEAEQEVAALGPEQSERASTPLFFRKPEQRPIAMRSVHATLQSQQVLVAGMLWPAHLLDLVRNLTVFQQVDGKTRKVVARSQQFRAIYKAVARLQDGRTRAQGAKRNKRGGIIWHYAGLRQEPQHGFPGA